MKCPKCHKESKNLKECSNCGYKLGKKYVRKNEAGIRRNIKAVAKKYNKNYYISAMLIYILAVVLIFVFFNQLFALAPLNSSGENILLITSKHFAFLLFSSFLYYAIVSSALKSNRGKKTNLSDMFNTTFENVFRVVLIFAMLLVLYAIFFITVYTLKNVFGLLLLALVIVLAIYYWPVIDMTICMLSDHKHNKLSFNEIIIKSNKMVKNKRIEYYGLILSFFPQLVASILTLGIYGIIFIPYLWISITNLYLRWSGEKSFNDYEKGLSNNDVVGLFSVICLFLGVICGILAFLMYSFERISIDTELHDNIPISKANK